MEVPEMKKGDRSNYSNPTNGRKSMARLAVRHKKKRVMNGIFLIRLLEKVDVFILNRGKNKYMIGIYERWHFFLTHMQFTTEKKNSTKITKPFHPL